MAAALQSDAPAPASFDALAGSPVPAADRSRSSGFLKTFAALAGVIGTIVAVVWLLDSGLALKTAERALAQRLASAADARANAMALVLREVTTAADPLTRSDLVRVVAGQLAAESGDGAGQRAGWLRAQVPFVRSSLADFRRAHGLDGVALLGVDGRPLLHVGQVVPPPVSDAWQRGPAFGRVRPAADDARAAGPRIDAYVALGSAQLRAGEEGASPVGILALTLPVTDLWGDLPLPDAGTATWLAQPGPDGAERVTFDPEPALVAAPPGPARDPLWPLVGDPSQPIVASAAVPRAPFRVVSAAPAEVLLGQAKHRARITLPLALGLGLGLAWLLAWWHHRHPAVAGLEIERQQPRAVPRDAAATRSLDEGCRLEPFASLVSVLPTPVALVDDEGCVAAASPAFTALAAGPGIVGLPLKASLADPAGASWHQVIENARVAGHANAVVRGPDQQERTVDVRRLEAAAGGALLVLVGTASDGDAERRLEVRAGEAMVAVLVRAVELRDPFLLGQTERMRRLGGEVAERLGLSAADRRTLDLAAALSQTGKIFVPDAILTKHGRHDAAEAQVMRAHIEHAASILQPLDFGLPVAETLLQMHERLDGSGYPRGLSGDAIGLPARILGVVDVYCARTSARSYRDRVSPGQALYHLAHHPGRYDPQVVAALAALAATAERRALPRAPEQPSPESDAAA